jgi:hypothetical protein
MRLESIHWQQHSIPLIFSTYYRTSKRTFLLSLEAEVALHNICSDHRFLLILQSLMSCSS